MSKLGDALRGAAAAAKAARQRVKETIEDVASGADDVKQAVFDDDREEGHDNGVNGTDLREMTVTAMDGMAALITVIDDVGDAVSRAEGKSTSRGKAPDPGKVMDAVVAALEPREGTKADDGNDSIRAFLRGILYCGAAINASGE